MKIPKQMARYCPSCKEHKPHKAANVKKKNPRTLSKGTRQKDKNKTGHGGHGNYSRKGMAGWNRKSKVNKKTNIVFECTGCKKKHLKQENTRTKRLEYV